MWPRVRPECGPESGLSTAVRLSVYEGQALISYTSGQALVWPRVRHYVDKSEASRGSPGVGP